MKQKLTIHSTPEETQAYHTERGADNLDDVKQNQMVSHETLKKIAENTKPKDTQEISIKGLSVMTLKGDKGDTGIQGQKGETGEKGDVGDQGLQGEQGFQGIQGERGEKGPKGDRGLKGDQGLQGLSGLNGKDGLDKQPETGESIIEKINPLKNSLDFQILKNVPDFITSKELGHGGDQGGGGGSIITFRNSAGGVISQYVNSIQFGTGITPTYSNGIITITASGGAGSVASVTGTTPIIVNNTDPANPIITIQVASTSQDGYLSATDWNTFNNKQGAITLTTTGSSGAATFISNTLNIPNYTYTLPTASTSVLGGVKVDGTTITISGGVISATGGGTVTSVSGTTNRITSTGGATPVIDISATFEALLGKVANPLSQFASTTSAQLAGVISDETGSGALVFGTSPVITLNTASTAVTQTPADNSTKVATTAYVDAAVNGTDFKEAALVATTANLVGVYLNGASGVGATFTYTATGTNTIDGVTLALGNRVLVKNQSSTFQNGIYSVTTAGALGIAGVLTRTADFNESADIDSGDTVFVTSGTAQTSTTWTYNGVSNPVMGTDPITFVQISGPGSITSGNGITVTGLSIAIDTSVTVDKTTAQALTNKTIAAGSNTITGLTNTNLSGSAGITNANLANSTVTIGSTSVALGAAVTTFAGLVSVTSTTFVGALTGNASTATNVAVGGITGLGTGVATALVVNVGTAGSFVVNGGTLGTPSSGTGTNITGIPAANILAGSFGAGAYVISTSLQVATIELGAATDTTLSRVSAGVIAVEGVTLDTISAANTLSNKTIAGAAISGALTGTGAYIPVTLLNSGTGASATTFWRGDGTWATPAAGGGITIGTTAITSGTTGRVLYDNAGVVGEYTAVPANFGGTGVANNVASTVTLAGAFPLTLNLQAATNITLQPDGVDVNIGLSLGLTGIYYY